MLSMSDLKKVRTSAIEGSKGLSGNTYMSENLHDIFAPHLVAPVWLWKPTQKQC